MALVSELPPPTGKPVAYALTGDPWAEQARRREAHHNQQKRRRRRALIRVAGLVGVAGVAGGMAYRLRGDAMTPTSDSARGGPGDSGVITTSPAATDQVEGDAAQVSDVWLLDFGDDMFGWGAILLSNADALRGDLAVSMIAFDADGAEVYSEQLSVRQLAPRGSAALGGVFEVQTATPTRLEVTATLGSVLPDEARAVFSVSNVRRVTSGRVGRDDRLLGTVELSSGASGAVHVAAIWRDEAGRVEASVFDVLDPVEIGETVDFSLRVPRHLVPAREPDTIVASLGDPR